MTSQTQVKNMLCKYTGDYHKDTESVSVNAFPSPGDVHRLTMTGGDPNLVHYIYTRFSKSKGVANRQLKTRVYGLTRCGNKMYYKTTLKLQNEEEYKEHQKKIKHFIAGIGEVPRESKVKTLDDAKKFFIYHLCSQAASLGCSEEDEKIDITITKEETITNEEDGDSFDIDIGDYKRNIPVRYKWTKSGMKIVTVINETDHSLTPLKDKLLVLKGEMQSGKTLWMITRSLMDVYNGRTALVILRELTGDQLQLNSRVDQVNKQFIHMCSEKFGIKAENVVDIVYDVHKLAKCPTEEKERIFSGETPKFVACISDPSPMSKVIDMIRLTPCPQFSLYIDESDYVDAGNSRKSCYMTVLKEAAAQVSMVSATIIENLFNNDVNAKNVNFLRPPAMYKGVRQFTFRATSQPIEFSTSVSADFFKLDKGLTKHMTKLGKKGCYNDSTGREMPPIHLFNLGSSTQAQKMAQKTLIEKNPNICSIVYNGDGITFYHQDFTDKTIKIGKVTMKKDGHLHTGRVSMADMLAFCETRGAKQFPRIAIFSGKLAGRGISYVSALMKKGVGWHVNHLRMAVPKSMNKASLLQAIGRLCGNFDDNIPLTLEMDGNGCDAAWAAFLFQENLLSEAYRMSSDSDDLMRETMAGLPISKEQRGDRNISATVTRTKFTNVVPKRKAVEWDDMPTKKAKKDAVKKAVDALVAPVQVVEVKEFKEEKMGLMWLVAPDCKYTKAVIEFLGGGRTEEWVNRQTVINCIMDENGWKNKTLQGSLTRSQQSGKQVYINTTKGLLFGKRVDGAIFVRYNR